MDGILYFGLESKSGYSNAVDKKWWEYDISQFGHRSIMNDMTAAIAIVQLHKLPGFMAKRAEIHDMYDRELGNVSWLRIPEKIKDDVRSSYYFYHIQIENGKRDDLAAFLRENGIYTTFRYFPLHWVKYYGVHESFPDSEYAALNTLCIPIHQALTYEQVGFIIEKIKEFGNS